MCGVFGQIKLDFSKNVKKDLLPRTLLEPGIGSSSFSPNYNIWTGMFALVLTAGCGQVQNNYPQLTIYKENDLPEYHYVEEQTGR